MTRRVASAAGRFCARFLRDTRGATAIEYALIAVCLSVAVGVTVHGVGNSLNTNFYGKVNTEFSR